MKAVGTKTAIRVVQVLISATSPLNSDGVWGPLTDAAYNSLDAESKLAIDAVLFIVTGRSVGSLKSEQTEALADELILEGVLDTPGVIQSDLNELSDNPPWEVEVNRGNTVVRDVRDLIKVLAPQEGVPVNTALKFFWIESKFNPNAISKTGAKGVGQLTTTAIEDVQQKTGYVLRDPFDPVDNITCSLKYMRIVADYLGIGLDDPVALYAGYNVGIKNAKYLLEGNPHLANARTVRNQGFGAPENYLENVEKKIRTMSA